MPSQQEQEIQKIRRVNFEIKGVPKVREKYKFWCGYASLSTVLQYWNEKLPYWNDEDLSPERMFQFMHLNDEPIDDSIVVSKYPAPNAYTMADIAKRISNNILDARILAGDDYGKIGKNPKKILQTFIINEIPCIIRTPLHFYVAKGTNTLMNTFDLYDTRTGTTNTTDYSKFENSWKINSLNHPNQTSYLILAIFPSRKNNQF